MSNRIKLRPRVTASPHKAVTAQQLRDVLDEAIKDGKGGWLVMLQVVEKGLTHADPVIMAFAAEAHDGEFIWVIADDTSRIRNAHEGLF